MTRQLSILAPTRYYWDYAGPRHSRHAIDRRPFAPLNRIHDKLEGLTVYRPQPFRRVDLIHAYNRIPLRQTVPFVIGFESHLPRAFDFEHSAWYRWLRGKLAGERCGRIIGLSRHAVEVFKDHHGDWEGFERLERKLTHIYPNMILPDAPAIGEAHEDLSTIRLVFVGGDFARKGGCSAVRLAQMALERGAPVEVTIISALSMGPGVWTDVQDESFYEPYRALLKLPNVRFLGKAPFATVLEEMARAHFHILTTFGDTFGFSSIDAMIHGAPVIGTRQAAMPEFIIDGDTGILLDLETDRHGYWVEASAPDRNNERFRRIVRGEIERLAEEAFARVMELAGDRPRYLAMRRAAQAKARALFDSRKASPLYDAIYEETLGLAPGSGG